MNRKGGSGLRGQRWDSVGCECAERECGGDNKAFSFAATAFTIAVSGGVVIHIFGLPGFAINIHIIEDNIATACVVSVLDIDVPGSPAAVCVILTAGTQGPGLNPRATNIQVDNFTAACTTGANNNINAAGTARAAT